MRGAGRDVPVGLERRDDETTDSDASRIAIDSRGIVRSDERVLLLFLLLLSIVALTVFLHYTASVLEGLPEVPPMLTGSG